MTSEFAIAVHALVFLNHKGTTLSSDELAQNICTNPARIRKIMAKLKKAGLVQTKEGVEGGYAFIKKAETVTLEDVSNALDISFVKAGWKSGSTDMDCMIASGMAGIMDDIYAGLDRLCKQHLKTKTLKDIDALILYNRKC